MPHPLDWLDDAIADLDRCGLRRNLSENARSRRASTIEVSGQSIISFGSNDYLDLASEERIAIAAKTAIDQYGWGAGASPLVTGRTALHAQLERALADFENTEAALLFPTGYAANVGTIAALVGKEDAVYSDQFNHASIIDGCRLSGAKIHVYPNNFAAGSRNQDLDQLANVLRQGSQFRRRLIVTESIFSMHGTFAPLAGLASLAQQHNAMLLVDEAHATGVCGEHGRGLCEQEGVEQFVHVRIGTLSKALGSQGGFVVGPRKLIDWLANRARTYGFSTAAPAAVAAAGLEALRIVGQQPERRERLQRVVHNLRTGLVQAGFIHSTSHSQIVPIFLGNPDRALAAAAELRSRGYLVPAIRPPSVPEGQSLLRISLTASHTPEHIDGLIDALQDVIK
jgi:8-amino-7-oxononanoate synthase